jgi:hypothetical protein
MRPFSSCLGLISSSIIYAYSLLLNSYTFRQENGAEPCSRRVKSCRHKLQNGVSVGATCVVYAYISILRLLNKYLSAINNKVQYVVLSSS